jgi:transposase InsO family protein
VHSDQGEQYASKAYRRFVKAHSFEDIMSKKGFVWTTLQQKASSGV